MKNRMILGLSVLLIVIYLLASPMPMGEIGQSFDDINETTQGLNNFLPATFDCEVSQVETLEWEITDGVSGTQDFVNTYDRTRAFFLWQSEYQSTTDDHGDAGLSLHWEDDNTIAWARGFNVLDDIDVTIHVVEFASGAGVTTYEVGPYSAVGAQNIGGTVVMANTFVINNGATSTYTYTSSRNSPNVYLSSTTQVTWRDFGADAWSDSYCQVVEVSGATVQRGWSAFSTATTLTVDIGDPVVIADSMMLVQVGDTDIKNMNADQYSIKYEMTTTDDITFTRYSAVETPDIAWEVVEWPEAVTVQHVATSMTVLETSDTVTISEVDTSRSLVFMAASHFASPYGGVGVIDGGNDIWEYTRGATVFASSTTVTVRRDVHGSKACDAWIQVIEFVAPNEVPVIDEAPTCTNLDDGDNLYAMYKTYLFTVNASDADGYADIQLMYLYSYDTGTTTERWRIQCNVALGTFTIISPLNGYIELDSALDGVSKGGNTANVTFAIKVNWTHPDSADDDISGIVRDQSAEEDRWNVDANYDYESRLDLSSYSLNDGSGTVDRGNYDSISSITASGTVIYFGSGNNYPVSAEVDVWVICYATDANYWEDETLTDGVFTMLVDSDEEVGNDTYQFKVVLEGQTSGGTDQLHDTHNDYYVADRIKVLTTSATVNYIEYGTESTTVNVTAELDFDSHALGSDDTLYMNGTEMTWDTDHFYIVFGPYSVFDSWLLFVNSSSANEATYGITVIWLNGQDDTVATDRVKVISYAISDARDNINDYIWINVTVQYESDSSTVTDGTIVINGYSFTHLGSGIWRHNRTQASAVGITFDTLVASSNTRGITVVNQNGQSQLAVWDSYTVSITVGDNRININVNATISFTVLSDYDSISYDGTKTLNYTTYDHATAQRQGYTLSALTGDDTYGITTISTNDEDYVIWDSLTITITNPTDQRVDLNVNASGMVISAVRDYDASAFDGSYTMNNTDYNGDGTAVRWGYTLSSATGGTYGITTISSNDDTYCIWDRVIFNGNVNMTWIVVGYYVNFSYTGTYEYDSAAWTGYATVANTSLTTGGAVHYEELTFSTMSNRTFYATAVEDAGGYGLTGFTTDTVWCVWDDIAFSSPNYYWVQYSADQVWLHWYAGATTYWEMNGTADSIRIQSQMNGTDDDWTYVVNNATGEMAIGPFNTLWYHANITMYGQFGAYNWSVWTSVLDVDILHTIYIENFEIEPTDYYFWIAYQSNWNNATIMIWDALVNAGTTCADTILNGTLDTEGMYHWTRSTIVGTHDVTILINGSAAALNEQNKVYTASDSWWWYNFTYVVDAAILSITNIVYSEDTIEWGVSALTNVAFNYTLYENDTLRGTITLTPVGSFYIPHLKNATVGLWRWGINCSDGTTAVWLNGSYTTDIDYGWSYVRTYTSTGEGFELEKFRLYINGTRKYDWKFYNRTDYAYEVTVQDYFGNELYNTTAAFERNVDVLLNYYVLKFYSQIQSEPVLLNLTMGGTSRVEYLGIGEILRYYLAAGNYTYSFIFQLTEYTGTINLGAAEYYVVYDLDLRDVMNNEKGGGDDDEMELLILTWLQYGIIGLFLMMFVLQIPQVQDMMPGKKKKKTSGYPTQLQGFEFGGGREKERRTQGGIKKKREAERT